MSIHQNTYTVSEKQNQASPRDVGKGLAGKKGGRQSRRLSYSDAGACGEVGSNQSALYTWMKLPTSKRNKSSQKAKMQTRKSNKEGLNILTYK